MVYGKWKIMENYVCFQYCKINTKINYNEISADITQIYQFNTLKMISPKHTPC